MARRITFVKPDGPECTTRSDEKANSGAPPVLVAFGDCDAKRLRQFAGALVDGWMSAHCQAPAADGNIDDPQGGLRNGNVADDAGFDLDSPCF
jgi:hypothetical protein